MRKSLRRVFFACLVLFLTFLTLGQIAHSESITMKSEARDNPKLNNIKLKPKNHNEIDDLLGPRDTFPFLPDNHRDSGTGKFSRFN